MIYKIWINVKINVCAFTVCMKALAFFLIAYLHVRPAFFLTTGLLLTKIAGISKLLDVKIRKKLFLEIIILVGPFLFLDLMKHLH